MKDLHSSFRSLKMVFVVTSRHSMDLMKECQGIIHFSSSTCIIPWVLYIFSVSQMFEYLIGILMWHLNSPSFEFIKGFISNISLDYKRNFSLNLSLRRWMKRTCSYCSTILIFIANFPVSNAGDSFLLPRSQRNCLRKSLIMNINISLYYRYSKSTNRTRKYS